jgi:hypothetical protein
MFNAAGARNGRQLRKMARYRIEHFPADAVEPLAAEIGANVKVDKRPGRIVRTFEATDPARIADFAALEKCKAPRARPLSAPRAPSPSAS